MNLDRARLERMLGVLGTSVGNKVMEVASFICFRIDKQNQTVVLATTDFHAYLTMDFGDVTLAGLEDVPDMFLIDYRELYAIVKGSSTDTVGFFDDGSNMIITTNGRYRFRKWATPEDFPFANMKHEVAVTWPVPEIQSAWNKASIACSKDVTKINYQGIFFDGNFAATDNRRLAVVTGGDYDGPAMLIPPVFGLVLKHCKNNVHVGINEAGNMLVISCAEVGLLAGVRLIDATFVPYQDILKKLTQAVTVILKKDVLLSACQRLSIFTDKIHKVVELKLSYKDGQWSFTLVIDNKDAGEEAVAVIEVDVEDGDVFEQTCDTCPDGFDIADHKYHIENLMEGVAAVEADNIELAFDDSGKMWITEGDFTYLLSNITGT